VNVAIDLRKFENQARVSVYLAILGAISCLVGLVAMLQRFDAQNFMITYNSKRMFHYAFAATLAVALACAVIGCGFGFNSAGQRRNKATRLSWIGFFVNAAIIALTLMTGVFFLFTRNAVALE
jgi:hypothetical protein